MRAGNQSCKPTGFSRGYLTPREVIFSIFVVGILFSIGFLISSGIKKSVDEKNLKYRQAIQIRDSGTELKQACETDVGNAFVEGEFKAVDTVTWEGLDGEHLWIKRNKEKYTMHTRTVSYIVTDSKGRPRTRFRIETYWTWDVVETDKKHSNEVTFCGNTYPYATFSYDMVSYSRHVKGTGWHTRDVFYYLPKEFRGSFFATLKDGKINSKPTLYQNTTIEELYKSATKSFAVCVFWVLWTMLMIAAVVVFVVLDNKWLEDIKE